MSKERIPYIDIAKGILICLLIYGHMVPIGKMEMINDSVLSVIQNSIYLYNAFFMQTFFIITGFCSSFKKEFFSFFLNNLKTLIIPSILLCLISSFTINGIIYEKIDMSPIEGLASWLFLGGPWFIISLFWTKIVFWFICRLNFKQQIIIITCLYLFGLYLCVADFFPNYMWHRHTLLMLPYLFIGFHLKDNTINIDRYLFPLAAFGVISILFQFIITNSSDFYRIPTHDVYIQNVHFFYIHFINVISGSAFIIWVSKKIDHNHFLEVLGKGTLLIYLWNELINRLIVRILSPIYNSNSNVMCCIFHLLVYIFLIISFYYITKIIYNHKYLNWIVGKW